MLERFLRWISNLWYGKPPFDIEVSERGLRSPHWGAVRAKHLQTEGACRWCGTKHCLSVHHVQPFHLHPELELEQSNLITLCELIGRNCHLKRGHLGNWKKANSEIKQQCDERRQKWEANHPKAS